MMRSLAPKRLPEASITLRFAGPEDDQHLAILAELDSARVPEPPVLLAEVQGRLLAAIGLQHGSIIADPFRPTLELVALLHKRAGQLRARSQLAMPRPAPEPRGRTWAFR